MQATGTNDGLVDQPGELLPQVEREAPVVGSLEIQELGVEAVHAGSLPIAVAVYDSVQERRVGPEREDSRRAGRPWRTETVELVGHPRGPEDV